jgi:hypothetical protein
MTTLKVYGTLTVTKNATAYIDGPLGINTQPDTSDDGYDLKVSGKTFISGNTDIEGNLYMGATGKASRIYANANTDNCIYFDSGQIYMAGPLASIASASIYLGKEPGNGNDITSTITVKGTMKVKANTEITGKLAIGTTVSDT